MRRRREITPIWRDVRRGTPTQLSGGNFVMNDGESAIAYYGAIVQLNGGYLLASDGSRLRRLEKN